MELLLSFTRTSSFVLEVEDGGRRRHRFYRLASEHDVAKRMGMAEPLALLADAFSLARKPLNFIASQYINTTRLVFGIPS